MTSRGIVDLFPSCAGLLGASGVAVSAAAAHIEGGGPATTAGLFLLFHAAALLGLSGACEASRAARFAWSGAILFVGTVLFSGELALGSLLGMRPLPQAAPLGGMLMIAGWLALPVAALLGRLRRRRSPE